MFHTLLSLITLYKEEYHHNYRITHLEDFARRQREYRMRKNSPITEYIRKHNQIQRAPRLPSYSIRLKRFKLIEVLGNICIQRGFSDRRALQLDHKNGGGTQEYSKFGGHDKMISHYIKNIEDAKDKLQVMCANCNLIKKYSNNEFGRRFLNQ